MTLFDAVVIGSGFGGSVAACRLAQAGYKVAILERGKRYGYGANSTPFPRDWKNPLNGWMWADNHGLFDVKALTEMFVVQSAGYGGGSLIYANVQARMQKNAFDSAWPQSYTRSALDPYYDLVATMLDISQLPAERRKTLPRAQYLEAAAAKLGRTDQMRYLNLAVNFKEQYTNPFGVKQQACQMCGECDIGCTYRAKNTLDLNYLADAEKRGAQVFVQHEVTRVVPRVGGYTVFAQDHAQGGAEVAIEAKWVFVCAGAVNSTELLLRNRDVHKTLPHLSRALGQRYSGNGDFLAFAMNTTGEVTPQQGPTITTGTVFDRGIGDDRRWFVLEDGGYPKQISAMLQAALSTGKTVGAEGGFLRNEIVDELKKLSAAHADNPVDEMALRSAVFLAMGRDRANGKISLTPVLNSLHIEWDTTSNMPLYGTEQRLCDDVAKAMGGNLELTPFWKMLHQPVSVHNLGGCTMGPNASQSVVDAHGEVYGYPGMFVLDGAALPASTGVNPSHTIAAVAERNIEAMIRRVSNQPAWVAEERKNVRTFVEPLDSVIIPVGGTAEPQTQALSVQFTETMRGYGMPVDGDYETCERAGQQEKRVMQFTLTITCPDIDRFIADKNHAGVAQGTVTVAGLTPPEGVKVTNGVFNLFVPGDNPRQRKMLYALPFTGIDGKQYLLDGFKDVEDDGTFDVWKSTTTLYTKIRQGTQHTDPVVATGILVIGKLDFMHQLTTFKVLGTTNKFAEVDALMRFGKMFMGSLWDVFIKQPHIAA